MDESLDFEASFASDKLDESNREMSKEVSQEKKNPTSEDEEHKKSDSEGDSDSSSSNDEKENGVEKEEGENDIEEGEKSEEEEVEKEGQEVAAGPAVVADEPIDTIELTSNEFENDLLGAPVTKVAESKAADNKDKEEAAPEPKPEKKDVPAKIPVPCPKIHSRTFDMDTELSVSLPEKEWVIKPPADIITTTLLKDLIDVKLKKEEEVVVETNLARGRRNRPLRSEPKKKVVKKDDDDGLDYEMESENESDSNDEKEDNTKDPTAFPSAPAEPAPRSRKSANRALLITNLIRPFTVLQLKTMLSHCGKVKSIWINTIKSRCYVVFSSIEEATRARESLHGAVWPSTSPKLLTVDYAEDERMYSETDGELVGDNIDIQVIEEQKRKKPKKDKDKKEKGAGNVLDDLFKKTKALPSIYWLPHSDDEAKKREAERAKSKPRYFEPEPLDEPDYVKPRAIPRWRTPERPRRDTRRRGSRY